MDQPLSTMSASPLLNGSSSERNSDCLIVSFLETLLYNKYVSVLIVLSGPHMEEAQ